MTDTIPDAVIDALGYSLTSYPWWFDYAGRAARYRLDLLLECDSGILGGARRPASWDRERRQAKDASTAASRRLGWIR